MSETNAAPAAPPPTGALYEKGGPATEAELRFSRKRMVQWLNPPQLCATGMRAVLGAVFGAYADQREMQAALNRPGEHDYSGEDELWLDYTADLGDGFRSSYTIAWLLAQGKLKLQGPDGEDGVETPRGRVLMLGGDQVYPTANRQEYQDRFEGPYEAALPWHPEGTDPPVPHLYAIPGNHDWYDGLTAFTRLFTQGRWVGGWKTQQTRSYWALKLPHGWWVLGTDLQLQSDLDRPQRDYFMKLAAEQFSEGDRVILLTAEPAWVHVTEDPACFDALAFFERKVIQPNGAKLVLTLTGDLHHYARYSDATDDRHKITAGGGGAYLYGTHRLPDEVELKERRDEVEVKAPWRLRTANPTKKESLGLRQWALFAPLFNSGFSALLAGVYVFYAWMLQSTSLSMNFLDADGNKTSFLAEVRDLGLADWGNSWRMVGQVLRHSPALAIFSALIIFGWWAFCTPDQGRPKWLKHLGALHGVLHLMLAVTLMWWFSWLNLGVLKLSHTGLAQAGLFTVEMLAIGGTLGCLLVGLFLLPGVNLNEAFSAQHRTGWKNFLRLHVDREGNLTVYPVGVRRAAEWEFVPRAAPGKPFFKPKAGTEPVAKLIEPPIRIAAPRPAPQPQISLTPEMPVVSEADVAAPAEPAS